jgi:hypothetical protein
MGLWERVNANRDRKRHSLVFHLLDGLEQRDVLVAYRVGVLKVLWAALSSATRELSGGC